MDGQLSARLIRRGDDSVFADLEISGTCATLATFLMTTAVHMLPFGLYELVVKSGECICGRFPVKIPKCKVEDPGVCEGAKVCLPPRDCIKPEEECPEEQDICDIWNKDCGNKVGEHKLELDWRITAR